LCKEHLGLSTAQPGGLMGRVADEAKDLKVLRLAIELRDKAKGQELSTKG
jgi:hypothetical protein